MTNRINAFGWYFWFAVAFTVMLSVTSRPSLAQQQSPDFEAPLLEHDETAFSLTDVSQVFNAQVVDNIEVSSVKLFYRFEEDDDYSTIDMTQVADSAFFSASLSIAENSGETTVIEYYLQAEDSSGNVVLKGYAFAPLTRNITPAEAITASEEDSTLSSEPDIITEKPKSRVLYYVLGALAAGALAAGLAGGHSDSDNPGNDSPCVAGRCTVTFTLNNP